MSTGEKMPLERAQKLADRFVELVGGHCERIDIAGSVRRKKDLVGDIEIVCFPKVWSIPNLLGEPIEHRIPAFVGTIQQKFKVLKGNLMDGRYVALTDRQTEMVKIDLFMPTWEDYYRQLAIRTGSADFSGKKIARGWVDLGWVGTPDGLRLKGQCDEKKDKDGNSTWSVSAKFAKDPFLPPAWESEKEFFKWLKLDWVDPVNRV